MVAFIHSILLITFHFFKRKRSGPFYPGVWVKRSFGMVSENLKFQVNNIVRYTKNYATFVSNPRNYYCLFYVLKSNWYVITWRLALGRSLHTQFAYLFWRAVLRSMEVATTSDSSLGESHIVTAGCAGVKYEQTMVSLHIQKPCASTLCSTHSLLENFVLEFCKF